MYAVVPLCSAVRSPQLPSCVSRCRTLPIHSSSSASLFSLFAAPFERALQMSELLGNCDRSCISMQKQANMNQTELGLANDKNAASDPNEQPISDS